jgi:ABC-type uncharacterized transport system substrate-binding protein
MKQLVKITTVLSMFVFLAAPSFAAEYSGKKILFVDSYHEGYAWSDGITSGIKMVVEPSGAQLKIYRMDTKRHGDEDFKIKAAVETKAIIESWKPDVVIASDDNASKYLIAPYYKDGALPFVFCGVNWDASGYGFPTNNVTGMVEVDDFKGLVGILSKSAKGGRIGFIADDTETTRKVVNYAKSVFGYDLDAYFSKDFEDFKKGFAALQGRTDMVIFYSYAGIKDWNDAKANEFINASTKIPTGTFQKEVTPFVMLGFLKIAEEQGHWAASSALKILDGTSPVDIPIAKNIDGDVTVNFKLSKQAGIEIPYDIVQVASTVIE